MDAAAITQLVTLLAAAMGIVWHQQHSTTQIRKENREDNQALHNKIDTANRQHRADNQALREEFNTANQQLREEARADNQALREEFNTANRQHREDFKALREDHNKLSDAITQNGHRLARIEGHLGIGIPLSADNPEETAAG